MKRVRYCLNVAGLAGVIFVLAGAIYLQLFKHEQPCPLCLLQRIAFICIAVGLLYNLLYGEKSSHWGLIILSALVGTAVSIRQICLHITSSQGFAAPVLGLHLYTWAFIFFGCVVAGAATMLATKDE